MRFLYPHRVYMFGLIVLIGILIYGIVVLYHINLEGQLPTPVVPFYGVVSLLLGRFYYRHYKYYKTRYVDIFMQYMVFCTNGLCIHMKEEDIDIIYMARHWQMLKIHRVIHIYGKDGTYLYITNDINKFNRLIMLLQYYYPNNVKVCKKLIRGNPDINKDLFASHLRDIDRNK